MDDTCLIFLRVGGLNCLRKRWGLYVMKGKLENYNKLINLNFKFITFNYDFFGGRVNEFSKKINVNK